MSKTGLEWYKREPVAYLGGVQGLTAREHAVYSVTLDLIYQHGGYINNDPRWIAGWISDMGAASVRTAIQSLLDRGKLTLEGEKLTQNRAKTTVKTKENQRETAQKNGKKGGEKSAEIRASLNENNDLDEPNATNEIQADKIREDKIRKKETNVSQKGTRLSPDWILPKEWGEWALSEGFSETFIRSQADIFKDYWIGLSGQRGVKADWFATWRNWLRRNQQQNPSKTKERESGSERAKRIAAMCDEGMDSGEGGSSVVPLLPARQPR